MSAHPQLRATRRFLLPYLVVLVVPTLVTSVAYLQTVRVVEEDAIHINRSLLERAVATVDRRIEEIDNLIEQIAQNERIQRFHFIRSPFDGENVVDILDTRNYLYNFNLSNDLVFAYYVHFTSSQLVMAPDTTYRAPMFYPAALRYANVGYDEWWRQMFQEYHWKEFVPAVVYTTDKNGHLVAPTSGRSVLRYLHTLGNRHFLRGTVEFLLDAEGLARTLHGLQIARGGLAYITDAEGRLLAATPTSVNKPPALTIPEESPGGAFAAEVDHVDMLITYAVSEVTGFVFVAAQPQREVVKKAVYVRNLFLLFVALSLTIGLLLALLLARREGIPFSKLIDTLADYVGLDVENRYPGYPELQSSISTIIKDNGDFHAAMEAQAPLLRTAFLFRLMNGGFTSAEQIDAFLSHIQIDIPPGRHAVAMLSLADRLGSLNASREEVFALDVRRLLVTGHFGKSESGVLVHVVDQHHLALIVNDVPADTARARSYLRRLVDGVSQALFDTLRTSATVGVGSVVSDLLGVATSYEHACQAMNTAMLDERARVVWYDDLQEQRAPFYLRGNMEARLQNAVKSGDERLAIALLDELYRENIVNQSLSLATHRLFLGEFVACLAKAADQVGLGNEEVAADIEGAAEQIHGETDLSIVYGQIAALYRRVCRGIEHRKKSRNAHLAEEIRSYLLRHFEDPQMCLGLLSTEFDVSEEYISTLFKEQIGVNLYRFLEDVRLEHARTLLRITSKPVRDVATASGYASSGTFSRAFKRTFGVRPSDYRAVSQHAGQNA